MLQRYIHALIILESFTREEYMSTELNEQPRYTHESRKAEEDGVAFFIGFLIAMLAALVVLVLLGIRMILIHVESKTLMWTALLVALIVLAYTGRKKTRTQKITR